MDYTDPQYWPTLKNLAQTIDGLDYFQVLNLPQNASSGQIRTTYYQMARALHPDRFFHLPDEELKNSVSKIYRRITESYTILKDDQKRAQYSANINGPERMSKLRFNEESEREQKEKQREALEVAKTPQGKKMFNEAVAEYKKGNYDKALKNLQSALLFESGNEQLKAFKAEIEAKKAGG